METEPVAGATQPTKVLDLLIVTCNPFPEGKRHLAAVKDEAEKLRSLMPDGGALAASAVSPNQLGDLLRLNPTRRFIFNGHADAPIHKGYPTLCFNSDSGGPAVVEPAALCNAMQGIAKGGFLELIFLNGCDSLRLGEALRQIPGLKCIVCWETPVADRAASIFSVAFFKAVQESINQGDKPDYSRAFDLAKSEVEFQTHPGELANGLKADVPRWELRKPVLEDGKDVSRSSAVHEGQSFKPIPWAAGIPKLLMCQLIGSRESPIPRQDFTDFFLERMVGNPGDTVYPKAPAKLYQKAAPALVLFPNASEKKRPRDADDFDATPVPKAVGRVLLQTKSGSEFKQSVNSQIWGEPAIVNFCSPSVEIYSKSTADFMKLYEWKHATDGEEVPMGCLESNEQLEAFLAAQLKSIRPTPITQTQLDTLELNITEIRIAMKNYRDTLERTEHPWRVACSTTGRVIACKLTEDLVKELLRKLGSSLANAGQPLYREESYDPHFKFGQTDYVVIDVEGTSSAFKLKCNKEGKPILRTINELAFEHTYAQLD